MKRFRKKKGDASEWTKYDDRLMSAAQAGDVSKLKAALKKGAGPNKSDSEGRTALQMASMTGHTECVEQLLIADSEGINVVDSQGRSSLNLAARGGHIACVELHLKYAADVSLSDGSQMTALHCAAGGGHVDSVKLLLQNHADHAARDKDGRTPLMLAASNNQPSACAEMVDRGAVINTTDNRGRTALMHASENGSCDCVEFLLKRAADREMKDLSGFTAGDFAQQSAHYGIVKILEEAPQVASWNTMDEESAVEKQVVPVAPEDMVSKFETQDEQSAVVSSLRSGSEASSAPRDRAVTSQSKSSESTSDQMKELEEENELLNQDLNKLRQEHAAVVDKLKGYEETGIKPSPQLEAGRPVMVDDSDNDEKIERLRKEILTMKNELRLAHRDKETLQEKIDTLEIQVTSFMPEESEEALDTDEELDFQEGEDFDLPGMETSGDGKFAGNNDQGTKANKAVQLEANRQVSQLRGQIATLRLENERLKEHSAESVNGQPDSRDDQIMKLQLENADLKDRLQELGGDTPTVPLDVYQQLKEAQEEEIVFLKQELRDMKQQKSGKDNEVNQLKSDLNQRETRPYDFNRKDTDISALQQNILDLQRQLQEQESSHCMVVNNYRSHLLAAVQGRMASEVQSALFGIINLRSNGQLDDVLTSEDVV